MKKYFPYLAIAVIIVAVITLLIYKNRNPISYKLEGKTYTLFVADSEEEQSRGLMGIKKLERADGMIFIFKDKQYRSFWNRNTHLNLDLYWLDGNRVVGKTHLPAIEKSGAIFTVKSPTSVNRVIEIVR